MTKIPAHITDYDIEEHVKYIQDEKYREKTFLNIGENIDALTDSGEYLRNANAIEKTAIEDHLNQDLIEKSVENYEEALSDIAGTREIGETARPLIYREDEQIVMTDLGLEVYRIVKDETDIDYFLEEERKDDVKSSIDEEWKKMLN